MNSLPTQENAHFSIAEALIAAIEQMKWNQTLTPRQELDHDEGDSDEEIQQLKQRIRIRRTECKREVGWSSIVETRRFLIF